MPIREVSVELVAETLAAKSAKSPHLLDVRTEGEHAIASISGAILIPLHELHARIGELVEEGWAHEDRVFVVCHHGVRSRTGAAILESVGFRDVASVAGGIEAWSVRVDASVPRY